MYGHRAYNIYSGGKYTYGNDATTNEYEYWATNENDWDAGYRYQTWWTRINGCS